MADRDDDGDLARTDDFESTRSNQRTLGCIDVQTPRGPVHAHDGRGFMSFEIDRDGVFTSIGVMVYDPELAGPEGQGFGLIAQFDAAAARTAAASLLRMADRLDPRKKH